MTRTKMIGLTFAQMIVGCCAGLLAGGFMLFWINLLWRRDWSVDPGGFLTAVLLLISFLTVYGSSVAGTAEGVRQMGRFIPKRSSRRKIYEGAFLGLCAAVAILTVTRSDWLGTLNEWGGLIRSLGTIIYYIIVLPVRLVTGWIPAYFLLVIAAPVGAVIGYNISPQEREAEIEKIDYEAPDSRGKKNRS